MVFRVFTELRNILNWLFTDQEKHYSISDDLKTNEDIINFDNAVCKSRSTRTKVDVKLSNGKIITLKAFNLKERRNYLLKAYNLILYAFFL